MKTLSAKLRMFSLGLAGLAISACATPYTGPIEVTRFVASDASALRTGPISTRDDSEESYGMMSSIYSQAVERELGKLGYTLQPGDTSAALASVSVEQFKLDASGGRSPVSVGVGGSTGSYGSGLGLGVGINLGGGPKPRQATKLSVRILEGENGPTLWEGRAELIASEDSPYADPQASAEILASALFRGFPGGNGETVTINVSELQDTK